MDKLIIKRIEDEIEKLPKGTLVFKKIKGKEQPYLQWNEGGRSVSKYIKKDERDIIIAQVEKRQELKEKLKRLKRQELEENFGNLPAVERFSELNGNSTAMPSTAFGFLRDAIMLCPDKTAFSDISGKITYRELYDGSYHVAEALRKISPGKQPVVIFMEKSLKCIQALYGVILSGNFYTVIEPETHITRINEILDVLSASIVITDLMHLEKLADRTGEMDIVVLEEAMTNEPDSAAIDLSAGNILPTDLMYVMFTSGSSGKPKGVAAPHRAVVDHIRVMNKALGVTRETIFGSQTQFGFVMSIIEIFGGVAAMATTVLIPPKYFVFPGLLVKFIEDNRINFLNWVSSALCMVSNLNAFEAADISCVKTVVFGGEAMPAKQLNIWKNALPDCRFINGYGSTEAACGCAYYVVEKQFEEGEAMPIGRPFSDTELLVIGENGEVIHEGTGELYVRSGTLPYSYYNDPEETKAVFVQNPLHSSYPENVYKTGDIVAFNERGELIYIGRRDLQITHMGWRIELGAIETAVSMIRGVKSSCCFYDEKKNRLVLVYTGEADEARIKIELKKSLPHYMQPARRIHALELPQGVNGKVDRREIKRLYS